MAILGLLVLLLCAVLFTPLRYQAQAACRGKLSTLDARLQFSVFFHLISGNVCYTGEKLDWNLRIAWKKLGSGAPNEKKKVEREPEPEQKKIPENKPEPEVEAETGEPEIEPTAKAEAGEPEIEPIAKAEAGEMEIEPIAKAEAGEPEIEPTEKAEVGEPEIEPTEKAEKSAGEDITESESSGTKAEQVKAVPAETVLHKQEEPPKRTRPSGGWSKKIKGVFEKIKYTFHQIYDKIKELLRKKDLLMDFVNNEVHQAAFLKALKELKKLLFRLRPKRLSAEIRFGFEDPSVTGQVLALISMLYPYTGEYADIRPDFENKVLEGSLYVKGHVRAVRFAGLLWHLILDKNIRITIRDIKNFSF